jgi:hypothetical protein
MNANATASNGTKKTGTRQSHVATFSKVLDGRKQPIRGLGTQWSFLWAFGQRASEGNGRTGEF